MDINNIIELIADVKNCSQCNLLFPRRFVYYVSDDKELYLSPDQGNPWCIKCIVAKTNNVVHKYYLYECDKWLETMEDKYV